jgi:hypothetical protein
MSLAPIALRDANAFVAARHRHHKPDRGCKFTVAAVKDGATVGVAVVGRPKSRMTQTNEPLTLEVTRVCTDGTRNACSLLYGACRRAAFAIGCTRLITYTLPSEGGASLRAAGFVLVGTAGGGSWSRPDRVRVDAAPLDTKHLWEVRRG